MSPTALYFASGESLYMGGTLLLFAVLAPARWSGVKTICGWVGLILMVAACPPLPWHIYGLFIGVFLFFLWAPKQPKSIASIVATGALAALVLVVTGNEFHYRSLPILDSVPVKRLVVIGDSLSSGIGRAKPWPAILQDSAGTEVINLAHPGAGVREAVQEASQVSENDKLILLEIGGNDLLANVPAEDFAAGLNALLAKLARPDRTLVMFELPLIPTRIAYGQIQRRLSSQYHVFLIPKRFLAEVLGAPGATTDSLHLSDAGSKRMADLVGKALAPRLRQ